MANAKTKLGVMILLLFFVAACGEPEGSNGLSNGQEQSDNEPGDGDEEPGDGDEEPGDGDNEPGDGDNEPGDGDNEPGDGDNEPGDGDNEPGDGDNEPGDGDPVDNGPLTAAEQGLYDAINEHRADHGLGPIPLSKSLTLVARAHTQDLIDHGSTVLEGSCNLHSWSDQGDWTACCYTPDHAQAQCMWDKPRELTNYPGHGYEISAWGPNTGSAAVDLWATSAGHNAVILNEGIWASYNWGAVGVGIGGGYAHVWFGVETDPDSF